MKVKNFNHLNVPGHWRQYWSRYPEGYTILESLINWVSQVDHMVDNVNDWNKYLDSFTKSFDKELQVTVTDTLKEWQDSGFLDVVINEALQTQMDVLEQETQNKLNDFDLQLAKTTKQNTVYLALFPRLGAEKDDTDRINRVLSIGGNVIFESRATYTITDTLLPRSGCQVYMNNAKIINNITTSQPVFWLKESNISIYDGTIENTPLNVGIDNATTTSIYGAAIVVGYPTNMSLISNFNIGNIRVNNGIDGVSAIILMGRVENAHIKNCVVDGTTNQHGKGFISSFHVEWNVSTVFSPRNIVFENCTAKNNTKKSSHGFYLSGCYNTTVKNCRTENTVNGIILYTGDLGAEKGSEVNMTVQDCHFTDFTDYGVSIRGTDTLATARRYIGVKVDNNYIKGAGKGVSSLSHAIRIYRNDGGATITNNKIKTANVGINADPCRHMLIDHNEFDDIFYQAIYAVQIEKSFITRNRFKDISTSGNALSTDATIELTFLSNDNLIEGNIFGYDGQTIKPRFHVYIKQEGIVTNTSTNNKFYKNTFFPTAGGFSIINGSATANFIVTNYVSDNVVIGADVVCGGATIYGAQGIKKVVYHPNYPTLGTWKVGDIVYNSTPTASGSIGWTCVTAGTPGTWKSFGAISE